MVENLFRFGLVLVPALNCIVVLEYNVGKLLVSISFVLVRINLNGNKQLY